MEVLNSGVATDYHTQSSPKSLPSGYYSLLVNSNQLDKGDGV